LVDETHGTVTRLLAEIADGGKEAETELFKLVYDEIHLSALRLMGRERSGHTLQPTALVGEVYLKLFSKGTFNAPNRRYFYGAVARAMRQVLIDHARKPLVPCVPLDEVLNWLHTEQHVDLLALKDVLDKLELMHPRHYRVVMQKVFAGRGMEDIAKDEKCSKSTIEKDWAFARGWLRRQLEGGTYER
jgi:RNA polymerase sigma factor (TIGR02999 family)